MTTATVATMPEGVYSLGQRRGGRVHAFLLDDPKEGLILIDTLFDIDGKRVIDQIQAIDKTIEDLKHIILTHAHRSHIGGLAELKKQSGATVYAHPWEADIIAGYRKAQGVVFQPMEPLQAYPLQLGLALGLGEHQPCLVDECLHECDSVGQLQVIHTPGHTPGSLAFHWPEKKCLFTGDVVVTWPSLEPGWKAFTLNFRQNRESIGKLTEINDVEYLCVGHGEPTDRGAAKLKMLLNQAEGAPPELFASKIINAVRRGIQNV